MLGKAPSAPTSLRSDFSSGICSCFEDFNICCCGCFCPGYLMCKQVAYKEGRTEHQMFCWEKACGCLISVAGLYWIGAIGIAIWEVCIRNDVRKSLNIVPKPGVGEYCTACICYPCVVCQQERELRAVEQSKLTGFPVPIAMSR